MTQFIKYFLCAVLRLQILLTWFIYLLSRFTSSVQNICCSCNVFLRKEKMNKFVESSQSQIVQAE